jgi:hypothetical protein
MSAAFITARPNNIPTMPVTSQNRIILIGLIDDVVLTVVRRNMSSGPLNDLVERMFGVRATAETGPPSSSGGKGRR